MQRSGLQILADSVSEGEVWGADEASGEGTATRARGSDETLKTSVSDGQWRDGLEEV